MDNYNLSTYIFLPTQTPCLFLHKTRLLKYLLKSWHVPQPAQVKFIHAANTGKNLQRLKYKGTIYTYIYILSITKHILLYHVQNSAPFRKPREKAERSSNCLSLLSIRHIFSISEENRQVNAKSMPPHNIKAPVLSKEAGATTLASHSNISGTAWQFTLATIDSMSHES